MSRKSTSIKDKLNRLFVEDRVTEEFGALLSGTLSSERFDNPKQLRNYLCEGALLNINRLASHSLSIPAGEYMVWVTDVGHTMLVPTKEEKEYQDVLAATSKVKEASQSPTTNIIEDFSNQYKVLTSDLLRHWNKVEMVLAEQNADNGEETEEKNTSNSEFKSRVNPADIDRSPLLRAMEDRGFTVTSLADASGVQAPAISRLLRTPKDRQGDPGGRNPSMGLAAVISKLLRMDPTALFPDIFGASGQDLEARDTPGNRGSGMSGAASGSTRKGGGKWVQGAE